MTPLGQISSAVCDGPTGLLDAAHGQGEGADTPLAKHGRMDAMTETHDMTVDHLEGLTADGSLAYQATCSCGWGGRMNYFEENATTEGKKHLEDIIDAAIAEGVL